MGEVAVVAGGSVREVIARDRLEGFDVTGSPWLRGQLRYSVERDDGRRSVHLTSIALHDGEVVPRQQAIELGYQLPDSVLESDAEELAEKQGSSFRVCFVNTLSFRAMAGAFVDENFPVDLSANSGNWAAINQYFDATHAASDTFVFGNLDAGGCTPLIARKGSGTQTWVFRVGVYAEQSGDTIYAVDEDGVIPMASRAVSIPSTGINFSAAALSYTNSVHQDLNVSNFLALNAIRRISTIGVAPQGNKVLRVSPNTTDSNRSLYCHTAGGSSCPTAMTLRIGSQDANDRGTVAHEVGHFIHATYVPNIPLSYTYSQANSNTFDTGLVSDQPGAATSCANKRTADAGTHSFSSIEWQSSAHMEGLANFFQAVTYNDTTEDDCTVYQGVSGFNCEAEGRSFNQCKEWFDGNLFGMVGNELDWTKMYWDFLTDYSTSFHEYMLAEKDVSSWPSMPPTVAGQGDHWGPIRTAMSSNTMKNNWTDAARGNIFDGPPLNRTQ